MKKYPLFPSQLGVFLECLTYPDTTQYNLPFQVNIDLCEDVDALVGTWKRLICATPNLRTRFEMDGEGNSWQWSDEDMPIDIPVKTMREAEAADYMQEGFVRPFDILGGEPLFRIEIIRTEVWIHLLLDFHHLVVDGFSYSFMTDRGFKSFFQGTGAKQPDHLFFELAEQEEEYFASEEYRAAQDYFASSLKGADFTGLSPVGAAVGRLVSSSEYMDKKTVDEWCRKQGVDAPSLFQAAFALTLGRLARTEEPAYLTSYLNRATRQRMKAQGMLVNQVAIKANLPRELAALDFLREMGETSARAYAMGRYPFIHLSKELGVKPRATFNFRPVKQILNLGDRKYSGTAIPRPTGQMDMNLDINLVGSDYEICATSSDAVNSEETVKGFTKAVKTVLLQILANPAVSLQEISLTGEEEKREILALSRGETLEYNKTETWLDLFRNHVKEDSGKIAVVDSKGSFTYGELDQASDSIAAYLLEKGVRPGSFVALQMGRVKEFLAAVIAVHKVGAAYVPIDPEYPEERIHYMLEDSEAHVVLTEETVAEAMAKFPDASPLNRAVPEGKAYMIYTSGSTGKPKGVVIRHKAMTSFVHFIRERWHLTEKSRIACHSTFSFDASVEDLYPALTVGGCVCIVPEEARRDIFEMKAFLKKNAINGGCYSTQFGQLLASGSEPLDLDYICVGGEAMTRTLNVRGSVYNTYGPTEFTVDATYFELEKGKDYASIPIGRPVSNAWAFVCDPYGHLLPQGMTGELCLAGDQIAEGYWKQPELTAKSFVDCSFLPGQKMYRTGDLARYNEEGQLEYLGRIDTQVKLRGFRIEMGEIETRAGQFAGIESVAAEVRREQLVLYYTSAEGSEIDAEELRHFLAETLADYMVPTVYVPLSAMPMTPSGKIDRKALPEPEWKGTEYVAPANETESALAGAFGEILGIKDKLGAFDDFFLLGGDSIKAIRLVSLLREKGIRVSVSDIMSQKTVRRIASRVERSKETAPSQEPYEGQVPDTAIVSFFKDLALPEPWHYNQCLLLAMRERGVLPALQKAMDALAFQHDLLRAVWRVGASVGAKQSHHAPAPTLAHPCASEEHLFVRDSGATLAIEEYQASSEGEITRICNDIQSHIQMEEALVRVALIHGREKDYLFIAAHHLVVDGVSWRILASDLERAYGAALSGADIRLPEKTHTYRDYAEALRRYRDSFALRQEIPYWKATEEKMKGLPLSKAKDYSRSFEKLVVAMDKEGTAKFLRGAFEKIRGDVNDALLTAVGRSFAKVQSVMTVSFQMEGHGRENLGETLLTDRTVGWFTSIYPVVVEGLTGDMLHDLLTTKEALHRVPNKGVGYNVLRFVEGRETVDFTSELAAQIGFNYLGDMSVEETEGAYFAGSRIDTGDSFSRKNLEGPDISINCHVMDGCFSLHLAYARNVYDRDRLQRFAQGILDEMQGIASFLKEYDGSRLTATDLGENEWSEEEFEAVLAGFAERGERIERIYPLLPLQEGMLLKHVTEPESWAYRLVDIYEMDWVPEESRLRRALARLGKKHEVLRTAILHEQVSVPRQAIVDRPLGLSMRDLSGEADTEAAVKRLREEILAGGFDLEKKPLFHLTCAKKDGESCYLLLAVHHIIVDGWCAHLYMGDLVRYLKEEKQGRFTEDTEVPMTGVYESAVRELLRQDREKGLAYWRGLLESYETKAEISSYGEVPKEERAAEDECSISLDEDTTERLVALCRKAGATPGNGVELLWGLILSVCSRAEDVVFAKVVSGRDHTETDVNDLVGLFINSVPVRLKLEKTTTAQEALAALQEQTAESSRYDYCPLSSIQQQTSLGANLFQTVLAFENYNSGKDDSWDFGYGLLKPLMLREENFDDISPSAYIMDGRLHLNISFQPFKYREKEIQRVLGLFKTLAEGIVRHPEQPLSSLARLNPAEREEMLRLSRGEELEYNKEETWLDLFLNHAKNAPDKTAVADGKGAFTYGELERASDSIAAYLLENGVAAGVFVALQMGRVKEFLAAVIAVHKVGAAYVPIDPEYPEERIRYMLEDSEAHVVLTEETIREAMAKFPDAIPMNRAVPEGRAYMIYTSGSTGKPKGVVIRHKAMTSFVHFIRERWHLTEKSRIACHSTFSFDASVEDLYPALTAGGCVFIVPEEARRDIFEMKAFLKKNAINGGCYSTQFGQLLASENEPLDLDYIVVGGEAMTRTLNVRGPVYNTYGPTEFTVDATYFELEKGKDYASIPIGRPVSNAWAFVCDTYGHLLPQGMTGELCLAGSQLAEGYWKQPELTAKSFVDCSFLPGQKMYRTGDLARYNEEGQLEYLGRIDTQVKLRGFRIEMGEIENRAGQFEDVEYVAAAVKKEQLVLYYTSKEGTAIDREELRRFLSETLTDYMVPTAYMPLSVMPMTPSGKIDRKALPEPEWKGSEYVAPVSETERALAEAFGEILGIREKIGASEDFFLLGGDSIKAIRLVSRLRERGIRVSVSDIMSRKTVRGIASQVKQSKETAPSQEPYEGQVPDTAIVSFFKDLALPEPWHYNQCLLLSMRERGVLPALQKAMDALAFQHDLLRAVWRAQASHHAPAPALAHPCASVGAKQSHHAPAPTLAHPCASEEHLFVRDSGATLAIEEYQAASEEEITKICNDIQSHIQMEEALVRVALIHGREKDYLFIAAHHLVVDGVSWRILASDLERAYGAALLNNPIQLPEKSHTYRDYAEALQRYRDSYALRQEIPYWKATEGKMKGLPLSKAKDYSRSLEEIVVMLDGEGTAKFLRGEFEKIRGNVNDVLLAAVGRSFAKVWGVSAVSFQMEGHGREDLGEPLAIDRTVGWFTSIYPVVVEGLTGELLHDLLATKEALHRVPNKGVGYNVLRFVEGREKVDFTSELAAQIGFNYLGDMSVEETEGACFAGSRIDTGDSFSRKNLEGPDISINCHVMDGCFSLHLAYARDVYDRDTAQRFAQGILDEMQGIASFLKEYDGSRLTATDLGEYEWSEEEFEAVLAGFAERGERIERIYPLLPMQEGMLLKHVTEPESWAYRLVDIYEMDWVPEESQLRRALARLGKKHEVLRTAILHEKVSVPRQAIVDRPLGLSMRDLSGEADTETAVRRLREEILSGGFDLEKKPLFHLTCAKKDGESCYLLLAVHHIIVDGWCAHRYMGDLVRYLKEEKQGRFTEDTEVPMTGVYESAVRELLRQDREKGLAYWRGLLEGYETRAEIPSFGEVPEEERAAEDECSISLDEDTTERLVGLCRKAGATPGNGVELLWGLVLSVCSRTEDVVFAKVVSGRDHTETDVNDLVGIFINSVPVRLKLEKTTTAQEALAALQEQTAESNRYDYCPLDSIQQQTELGANLFQTVLAFENYNSGKEDAGEEARGLLKPLVLREENFDDISPSAYIMDGRLHLSISFQPSKYREKEIRRVMGLFKTLAEGIVRHPEQPLSSLARLNPAEREEMLRLSRGEELEYNMEETWLDLFQSHAKRDSGKIAVADSKGAFTYGELDRASNSIAAYLLENGAAAGDFVALQMGRVKEFLAAVIAVHKAGAAYVPIDPEYPEERIHYMQEDSEAHVVLTEETIREAMAKFPDAVPMNRAVPKGRAYMIYTSGSTGKPKGVVQSHRSLRALVAWRMAKFGIATDSVHAEHASFSFDTSLNDLITPLAAGGILHIIPEEMRRDMAGMKDYFAQNHVNGITLSTQIGMAMVNQYPDMPLRYLMMGGEKMLPCKKTKIRLINEYGPTEFTVCASYHVVEQDKEANIPIGRPVPNTYSFICDSYGHLLPQGMAGELCLAGSQIAEGYWKKPELTTKSFVECSFLPGQKMYRTGDLARYNEDGELEYLGRIDTQVKLRGFRIEMGEIENRAAQFAGIEYVAAAVKKEQLILYYTSAKDAQIDAGELRSFLEKTLTEYMVPTVYMPLSAVPMTPSGKIDRKALPEPDISLARAVYEAPVGDMERRLCAAFEQVLGLEAGSVGRNDDFFLLGGSSIKAMLVMTGERIEGLSTRTIFKHKTPRRIAEAMSGAAAVDLDGYEKMARERAVPATSGQLSMIDYQFTNVNSVMHNLPAFYRFDGALDAERLAAAVDRAAKQHPALSSVFDIDDEGVIVQRMVPDVLKKTAVEHVSPEELKALSDSLMQPFHIFRHPLFRARVFRCDDGVYLFMDMHHTISDGVSQGILLEDIARAYRQEELEPDYYYSYVLKEYENQGTEEYKEAERYFDRLLSGRDWCIIPTPDFDSWGTEAGAESFQGMVSLPEMSRAEKRWGVSRNILAIAAAMLALREYCQRDEIRIDYINNNRTDAYLQHTVGLVFKIFPVAVDLRDFPTVEDFLREVNRQLVEGFAHSICDYGSFDKVALEDALDVNYITNVGDASDLGILNPRELELDASYEATECRVELYLTEEDGQVNLDIDYQKNAYAEGSMKKFMNLYVEKFRQLVQG